MNAPISTPKESDNADGTYGALIGHAGGCFNFFFGGKENSSSGRHSNEVAEAGIRQGHAYRYTLNVSSAYGVRFENGACTLTLTLRVRFGSVRFHVKQV